MKFVEFASKGLAEIDDISKADKVTIKCKIFMFLFGYFMKFIVPGNTKFKILCYNFLG